MLEITNIQQNSAVFLLHGDVVVEQLVVESSRLHPSHSSELISLRNTPEGIGATGRDKVFEDPDSTETHNSRLFLVPLFCFGNGRHVPTDIDENPLL